MQGTDGTAQRQLQDKLKKAAALGGGSVQIEFMDDFEPGKKKMPMLECLYSKGVF